MPRPTNKQELLDLSQLNFEKLLTYIDALPEGQKQKEFPSGYLNRNIRDVLAHLHHWHQMTQDWYKVGMTGEKPDIPAKGYTWKTTPDLNREIQKQYKNITINEAQSFFESSHKSTRALIESHTNEELFEKKRYKWTGTTSMGSYFVSVTSSHYDWALKLIKKCLK